MDGSHDEDLSTGRTTYVVNHRAATDNLTMVMNVDPVRPLDHETMWTYMRRLLERVSAVSDDERVLDECLDIVVGLLGADRGLLLMTQSDSTSHVIRARGSRGALAPHEQEEISRTIVREAMDTDACVVWDLGKRQPTSASIATLGILTAMAAPVHAPAGGGRIGVLYIDFRNLQKIVGSAHIDFFMAAVVLFGAVLDQRQRNRQTREQLEGAQARCVEGRTTPPLHDLLAFDSMSAVRRELETATTSDCPILILGESGTGKTLLAQAIAAASGRRPIVRAVLGGSDDLNTISSELFGHERGAFSGSISRRTGLVEYADGGTLILDELLNLPMHAQRLLLDFTQFGSYRPLGYSKAEPKVASVRIIAATNGDLKAAIKDGRLREDLYFRLAAVTLTLPALRTRREDLPALAESTLRRMDRSPWSLSLALRKRLLAPGYDWPGNVRQFERVIQRARERAIARDPKCTVLEPEHLDPREFPVGGPPNEPTPPAAPAGLPTEGGWKALQTERRGLEQRERQLISEALSRNDGVVAHAARDLGIPRTTLAGRIEALGLPKR